MSKPSSIQRVVFVAVLGILIILACTTTMSSPSPASPPTLQPTQEKVVDIPVLLPTAILRPTLRPTKHRTPRPTHTNIPVFPTSAGPEIADISNACTLVDLEEVAALFPNSPQPVNELKQERGYTVSNCTYYKSEEMSLSISIAISPDFISQVAEYAQNIKAMPSSKQFSYSGAEIYQVGTRMDNVPQDVFAAIIIKDNIAVKIEGTGISYIYHAERETSFLKAIASRLPLETTVFNACDLITAEEVSIRFPNPPVAVHELFREEGFSISTCTFHDDSMDLTLKIGAEPGANQELSDHMKTVITEFPSILQRSAFGADIYQWGGPNKYTGIGELFAAIIIKGNNIMEIEGQGTSYQYDESREIALIETIASRLP